MAKTVLHKENEAEELKKAFGVLVSKCAMNNANMVDADIEFGEFKIHCHFEFTALNEKELNNDGEKLNEIR